MNGRTFSILTAVMVCTGVATSTAIAQKATEVFIPIGQSPGLSDKHTTIGIIDSMSMKDTTMMVSDSGRTYIVRFTKETRVYVDRSSRNIPNTKGTLGSCRKGMRVEVKYVDNKIGAPAEWIKVKEEQYP